MRRLMTYAAALFIFIVVLTGCKKAVPAGGETPENIFNMATEAMVKGNDVLAIDLYYKLINSYPEFKKYREDSLYRLGTLLYKTERYEEAEKAFAEFAAKYKKDSRLRKVYEKLIYIYMQEFHDEARAQEIRDLYAKKFKESPVLRNIDKTINVLSTDEAAGSAVLALHAGNIGIIKVTKTDELDKEFFPVRNYILKSVKSPDGKYMTEKKKSAGNYYLYYGPVGSKLQRISGSSGGYAPQWSWANKYIVFTSMDWQIKERKIKLYDLKEKKTRDLFRAKGVGPLLCVSPDSSKIVFVYLDKLWIMNSGGNAITLLSKNINAENIRMLAWSREGDSLVFSRKNEKDVYYQCELGRREIEAIR